MKTKAAIFPIAGAIAGAILFSFSSFLRLWVIGDDPYPIQGLIVPVIIGGLIGAILSTAYSTRVYFLVERKELETAHRLKLETEILERKRTEQRVTHLNLALQALRRLNQPIMTEKQAPSLVKGICEALITTGAYLGAWIALVDRNGAVVSVSQAGLGERFPRLEEFLKNGGTPYCMERALGQTEAVFIDGSGGECSSCPMAAEYRNSGAGMMAVRLETGGTIYGVLCVSIALEFSGYEEELDILEEASMDVSLALDKLTLLASSQKASEDLVESMMNFRALVENSLVGISIVRKGETIFQNPELDRMAGGMPCLISPEARDHIHPEDAEAVNAVYKNMVSADKRSHVFEFRWFPNCENSDPGEMKWMLCRAAPIEYQRDNCMLINYMDITNLKRLEGLIMLQDKMASLGRVAAGIAHEIRNPLSGINIYLDTLDKNLEGGRSPKNAREIIDRIKSASVKIESVIRMVMDFAKPGETKMGLAAINPCLEEAVDLCAVTLRKKGIVLDKSLSPDLPQVWIDPRLISRVILNLLNNAVDAMSASERKQVLLSSLLDKQSLVIKVSDSGPGVPVRIRGKIFDPFYSTKDGSTGIGLSICQRIVIDHGGSLTVDESAWGGAEFTITLPIEETARPK